MNTEELERFEHEQLKPYACFADSVVCRTYTSNGKIKNINKHPFRTEFQRDRDRIIHSKAFRRLEYKTQVFLTHHGDHLRTRLTHSLEVSQLSETIALQLGLNCDLVEAIALGHDVGHTPFGHAGEKRLGELLKEEGEGTFKHNVQSVKVLKLLEKKYTDYDGLKLTIPVLEGILKHTKIPVDLPDYCNDLFIDRPYSVTLEGQIVFIADEIAQITHDMDDYLRYSIVKFEDLLKHPIFDCISDFYKEKYGFDFYCSLNETKAEERKKDTIIRCIVDYLVTTLIFQSQKRLFSKLRAYEINDVFIKFEDPTNQVVTGFHKHLNSLIFSDYRILEMDMSMAMIKCNKVAV